MAKPLRVLAVEDSENDLLLVMREIRRGGYDIHYLQVETSEGMRAALEEQEWDVIISDYVMPRFSGLDALKILKGSGIDIPFIIVSGNIGEDIAVGAMKAGAHDYILKDNLARLVPAIERELGDAETRRQRRLADEALKKAHDELEIKVRERTAELRAANEEKEKLIQELRKAITEVKTLSGLLPICASCKKIRDDSGYWNQIEVYIKAHSRAEFSHGLCPDCAKRLYPQFFKDIKS